uniref:Uncharacterized protein n=1 Tax=Graphocephala atropunctata TaxID=36148 RepID=A0A1B6LG53_9HEMI
MNVPSLTHLPSDPDVTVILVKKCLQENHLQHSKSGDGKNTSASSSLVNFVTHKGYNKDDTISNDGSLFPITSWDPESASNFARASMTPEDSTSRKVEHLFRVSDRSKSVESVCLKTIQASYAESELSLSSNRNDEPFTEIDLQVQSARSQHKTVDQDNGQSKQKCSPFTSCFSCILRKKISSKK